jgi:hypothetical protein
MYFDCKSPKTAKKEIQTDQSKMSLLESVIAALGRTDSK